MQTGSPDQFIRSTRRLCVYALVASAAAYIVFTFRWPWMWDEQVFHYDVFLMQHGKVPYRDIYDLNLPGCLMLQRWAMAVFGGGDIGWRIYEYVLLTAMTISAMVIARRFDWAGGLFAGVSFAVLHGADGAAMSTERDEVITVLLMFAFALVCVAVRRGRAWLLIPAGFVVGMATLIKPTAALFGVLLLAILLAGARAHRRPRWRYAGLALAGLALSAVMLMIFMLPEAMRPFIVLQQNLQPYYGTLGHPAWMSLLKDSVPLRVVFVLVAALVAAVWNRERAAWELWGVRGCAVLGAVSYFVQRKGYTYHRYPLLAFALLWAGMEFCIAMRTQGRRRYFGAIALAASAILLLPSEVNTIRHSRHDSNPFADQLQVDLRRLGGDSLQDRVQCLDLVTGCYSALYRAGLVQSTGWMGDLAFFGPDDHKIAPHYRDVFWNQIHENPPRVIVLSSEWFGAKQYSFDKLDAWPQLRDYLNSAYVLDVTRTFGRFDQGELAYRIYVLK